MNIPLYVQAAGILLLSLENAAAGTASQAADASGLSGAPPPGSDYTAFDMEYLRNMADVIWNNIGTIVNTAVWIFLIVLGVFTAITIIKSLAR